MYACDVAVLELTKKVICWFVSSAMRPFIRFASRAAVVRNTPDPLACIGELLTVA